MHTVLFINTNTTDSNNANFNIARDSSTLPGVYGRQRKLATPRKLPKNVL
jgi:hypothetical protein